jgi:hypothetical protein
MASTSSLQEVIALIRAITTRKLLVDTTAFNQHANPTRPHYWFFTPQRQKLAPPSTSTPSYATCYPSPRNKTLTVPSLTLLQRQSGFSRHTPSLPTNLTDLPFMPQGPFSSCCPVLCSPPPAYVPGVLLAAFRNFSNPSLGPLSVQFVPNTYSCSRLR